MYKTEVDPQDVENKCMVAKGKDVGGRGKLGSIYIK